VRMLKQQVAEIHCEPHTFVREVGTYGLIDRCLRSKADGVVVMNAQQRGPEENLLDFGLWDSNSACNKSVGMLADQFGKHPPILFARWLPPAGRSVTIDQTVVEHIGAL